MVGGDVRGASRRVRDRHSSVGRGKCGFSSKPQLFHNKGWLTALLLKDSFSLLPKVFKTDRGLLGLAYSAVREQWEGERAVCARPRSEGDFPKPHRSCEGKTSFL